jgi:hypothetical protein
MSKQQNMVLPIRSVPHGIALGATEGLRWSWTLGILTTIKDQIKRGDYAKAEVTTDKLLGYAIAAHDYTSEDDSLKELKDILLKGINLPEDED